MLTPLPRCLGEGLGALSGDHTCRVSLLGLGSLIESRKTLTETHSLFGCSLFGCSLFAYRAERIDAGAIHGRIHSETERCCVPSPAVMNSRLHGPLALAVCHVPLGTIT